MATPEFRRIRENDNASAVIAQVAAMSQALWSGGLSLSDYIAHLDGQLRRSAGRMHFACLLEGTQLVASLKAYRLTLRGVGGGPIEAVGLGAIFTHPQHRRSGLAAQLIRQVLAEAATGSQRAALLFSDIGSAYYERFGFAKLAHFTWSADSAKLLATSGSVALGYSLAAANDDEQLVSLFHEAALPDRIQSARTVLDWRYWHRHNGDGKVQLLYNGDHCLGYVVARAKAGQLWIDELCTLPVVSAQEAAAVQQRLWATLHTLARAAGAAQVSGWLRPEHAGGPFHATLRDRCIPMLAWLDGRAAVEDLRAAFSSIDHF